MEDYDAVIVGSGINSLVAAAELAIEGWSVAIVEANARVGGFIASEEHTVPGFVHDTYSTWHPLFVSGGAYAALGDQLHAHGLEYCNTDDAVTASVGRRGAAVAYRDPARTADALSWPADRDAYGEMMARMGERAEAVFGSWGSPLRGPHGEVRMDAVLTLPPRALESLMRDAVTSGRAFSAAHFRGREVDQLWAPWLLHMGLSPDHALGGLMIPVFAHSLHSVGLPVVAGGASRLIRAFESLLRDLDVAIYTGSAAESILVADNVATGVVTDQGHRLSARRAVLASVTPQALYEQLLQSVPVPSHVRDDAARFRYGRAAMVVHVALDRPLVMQDERLQEVPLIHVTDGSSSTGIAGAQADAGMLPAEPTVVLGRQHLLDPTRVPEGKGSLWLQLPELPWRPTADSAGRITADGTWSRDVTAAYVDRVIERVASFAPGLTESILDLHALSPVDLNRANRNAVRGDVYAGAMEFDQSFLWRPLARSGGHATAVGNLWHIGASTHPGAGLSGGSGHLAAQNLLAATR
jgi:phytoene dehydrogenase-like protein